MDLALSRIWYILIIAKTMIAKVTSHPSIGLLQTVGMQSRFGTVNTYHSFLSRFVREEL